MVAGGGGVHGCQGVYVVAGGNMCGCWGACVVVGEGDVSGIRRDTVNEQAVRILLECILVTSVSVVAISLKTSGRCPGWFTGGAIQTECGFFLTFIVIYNDLHCCLLLSTGANLKFCQGGPASEAKSCRHSKAKLWSRTNFLCLRSRACLRPLEAFGFLMHSPTF